MFEKKHLMLQKLARQFAEAELAPIAVEVDKTGKYPDEIWEKIGRYGFAGITVDKKYGGAGGDFRSLALVMEQFTRVDGSASGLIMGNSLSGAPLFMYGNETQKEKYLRPLAEGKQIAAFALTEPGAGSDTASLSTTAEDMGDYYLLNGRKCFITMAPLADFAILFAKTDPKAGSHGISAFIVESRWDGYSTGKIEDKMGLHGSVTSDIILENVKVPKENLLGRVNKGFGLAMGTLNAGRVAVAAQALGLAQGALDEAVKYSKERIQFGRPLSKFQNTAFTLADMAAKVEAGRQLVYSVAEKLDAGEDVTMAAAMAKYYMSEVANEVAYKAVQIHGGYGYMREYAVERIYRDARILPIYDGTSEIQKLVISGALLK